MMLNSGNSVMNKLSSRSGETITETLVALLISALARVMLAGVIASSSRIVTSSRAKIKEYYNACNTMAEMTQSTGAGVVTIKGSKIDTSVTEQVSFFKANFGGTVNNGQVTGGKDIYYYRIQQSQDD